MWLRAALVAVAAVVALAAVAIASGRRRCRAIIAGLRGAMNDTRARTDATILDHRELKGLPAPVRCYLGAVREDGCPLIESVSSEGRSRDVQGEQVATPWRGRFWDYEPRGGMLVPLEGEVEWVLPEGAKPYWRGRIERIEYEFVNGSDRDM